LCVYVCVCVCVGVCFSACGCLCVFVCVCVFMSACMRVCASLQLCARVCVCTRVCGCVHLWLWEEEDRGREDLCACSVSQLAYMHAITFIRWPSFSRRCAREKDLKRESLCACSVARLAYVHDTHTSFSHSCPLPTHSCMHAMHLLDSFFLSPSPSCFFLSLCLPLFYCLSDTLSATLSLSCSLSLSLSLSLSSPIVFLCCLCLFTCFLAQTLTFHFKPTDACIASVICTIFESIQQQNCVWGRVKNKEIVCITW